MMVLTESPGGFLVPIVLTVSIMTVTSVISTKVLRSSCAQRKALKEAAEGCDGSNHDACYGLLTVDPQCRTPLYILCAIASSM
jgi:hypothetical protein